MAITDDILGSLKDLSKVQKVNQKGGFVAGMAIIESADIGEVEKRIEKALEGRISKGEKIATRLKKGEVVDSGRASFKILGGYVVEFYDYEKTSAVFIRTYLLSDSNKKWIAVYIDENAETLWWDRNNDS